GQQRELCVETREWILIREVFLAVHPDEPQFADTAVLVESTAQDAVELDTEVSQAHTFPDVIADVRIREVDIDAADRRARIGRITHAAFSSGSKLACRVAEKYAHQQLTDR